mmetsp:Transcript_60472/g.197918  ORF Transcript_60472/g.197918 Transcript_60472/m.197918 type:complete len:221 (+) Transcript_60472:275-937(+)
MTAKASATSRPLRGALRRPLRLRRRSRRAESGPCTHYLETGSWSGRRKHHNLWRPAQPETHRHERPRCLQAPAPPAASRCLRHGDRCAARPLRPLWQGPLADRRKPACSNSGLRNRLQANILHQCCLAILAGSSNSSPALTRLGLVRRTALRLVSAAPTHSRDKANRGQDNAHGLNDLSNRTQIGISRHLRSGTLRWRAGVHVTIPVPSLGALPQRRRGA